MPGETSIISINRLSRLFPDTQKIKTRIISWQCSARSLGSRTGFSKVHGTRTSIISISRPLFSKTQSTNQRRQHHSNFFGKIPGTDQHHQHQPDRPSQNAQRGSKSSTSFGRVFPKSTPQASIISISRTGLSKIPGTDQHHQHQSGWAGFCQIHGADQHHQHQPAKLFQDPRHTQRHQHHSDELFQNPRHGPASSASAGQASPTPMAQTNVISITRPCFSRIHATDQHHHH